MASATRVTRWLAPWARPGVVESTRSSSATQTGFAADLDDERLGDGAQLLGSRDPERAVGEPVEVHRRPGERHRRVERDGEDVMGQGGGQDADAVPPRRVRDDLSGLPPSGGRQARDEVGERVVGDGEEDELGPGDDVRDGPDRDPRQQRLGAGEARLAHGGDPRDVVTGTAQGGPEHRADLAGADDTHLEPSRMLRR